MNQTFSSKIKRVSSEERLDSSAKDVVDLSSLLGALWRGKWLIALIMFVAVCLGAFYAYRVAVPTFKSTAVVMLNSRQEQVLDLESVMGGLSSDSTVVNSEVEVLKSRSLMGQVVDKLDLTSDPEFNSSLRTPSIFAKASREVKALLNGGASPLGTPLTEEEQVARIRASTVNSLLLKITIRIISQSLVFEVSAETNNPRKSALIADTLVDLYILDQLETKFDATEQATSWLTNRVTELQSQLEQAEVRLKEFSTNTALVSQESLAGLERQLKETRDRILNAQTAQKASITRLEALRGAETPQEKATAAADGELDRLLPEVDQEQVRSAFDSRFAQILTRAELEMRRGESQLSALRNSETEQASQIEKQSTDLITLQQLTREADANRMLYEYFLSRLKETSAQQGIQQADSRRLSEAVIPNNPASPNKSLIMLVSAMLGFIIGSALVLVREARSNTFRTAQTLEQTTGYPVFGQVPILPAKNRKDAITYLANKPTSAAAEAVRNLRTSILFSNVDKPPQVLLITSSLPGEGKTTLSIALAQNFASMGKKVLLVEGDIRRRVFKHYMTGEKDKGLLSVISGKTSLQGAVIHDDRIGADVLFGDNTSTNAADLFSSHRFAQLLKEAREFYDQIIIDTPPVLIVPDARVIAQSADAIVFVVKWDSTLKPQVGEALHMFESVNCPVSGLVLNQLNPKGMKRYGKGEYSNYGYGGKYYVD